MKKPKDKTALDLALAVQRYNRMRNPAYAYAALHKEWPPRIARIIDSVLWSKIEPRSERRIVADLRALQTKLAARAAAVRRFAERGMSARAAIDRGLVTKSRKATRNTPRASRSA